MNHVIFRKIFHRLLLFVVLLLGVSACQGRGHVSTGSEPVPIFKGAF